MSVVISKNENNKTQVTFTGEKYQSLLNLAQKDFDHWEQVNSTKKEKLCFNSLRACQVGVFSEAAVYVRSKEMKGVKSSIPYGLKERIEGKTYRGKPDILLEGLNTPYVEVKGITAGYRKGMITPYHVNKYNNRKYQHLVVLVEIEHFEYDEKVVATIYSQMTPQELLKQPVTSNYYGKPCYQIKEFL